MCPQQLSTAAELHVPSWRWLEEVEAEGAQVGEEKGGSVGNAQEGLPFRFAFSNAI